MKEKNIIMLMVALEEHPVINLLNNDPNPLQKGASITGVFGTNKAGNLASMQEKEVKLLQNHFWKVEHYTTPMRKKPAFLRYFRL